MNSVVIAVFVVVILSLMRVSVVLSLMIGAIIAGLLSGMDIKAVVDAFNGGLGGGAICARFCFGQRQCRDFAGHGHHLD